MSADDALTFTSAGSAGIHYARCWGCICAQCPGGQHRWASRDDIDHAVSIGKPESAEGRCACPCYYEEPDDEQPDPDIEQVSIDGPPCHLCGAAGACGYDDEGRPYIHASWDEDERETCTPMGVNARGVAQCAEGHGDYPDACDEATR